MRAVVCYRSGELPAEVLGFFQQAVAGGIAVSLELGPLAPESIEQLVTSLDVSGVRELAPEIVEGAGGSPGAALALLRSRWAGGSQAR